MHNITELSYIETIVEIMNNNSGISRVSISDKDRNISLEKHSVSNCHHQATSIADLNGESAFSQITTSAPDIALMNNPAHVSDAGKTEIKSPIVGIFYAFPSPEAEPFVTIGSTVKKGDTLCIIEAMKLMNEFTAEQDGIILDICVKNGDLIEFGQTLFILGQEGRV